jgi:DNA topoisomerase-1
MTIHEPDAPVPAAIADRAGLCYVHDSEPGYQRKRWGRGFTFLDKTGNHITDKKKQRLEALAIPPAWTDVWICAKANGHIQVTGRDEKGRKQYIYHPDWDEMRDQVKFNRLEAFGEALPHLRTQVKKDLRRHNLSQQKVTALVVHLLDETLLRIGNVAYAEENGSYGLTTLQDDHTAVSGSTITFSFPGKSGKDQEITLQDRRLARLVRQCQELPGQHLFQYLDEAEELHAITSTDVNDYLRTHTGQDFTAKEFRTWGATVAAASKLATLDVPESESEAKKNVITAVKHAAQALGNTPTVCRQYYIHPAIVQAYASGELVRVLQDIQAGKIKRAEELSEIETAVLALVQS